MTNSHDRALTPEASDRVADRIIADAMARPAKTFRQRWYRTWLYRSWEYNWTEFYCRFSWFHLMRSSQTGRYIIVWKVGREDPVVEGHYIVTACWTPRGCRKAAENQCFFDRLLDRVGGRAEFCRHLNGCEPTAPESAEEIMVRASSRNPQELMP